MNGTRTEFQPTGNYSAVRVVNFSLVQDESVLLSVLFTVADGLSWLKPSIRQVKCFITARKASIFIETQFSIKTKKDLHVLASQVVRRLYSPC